MSGKEIPPLDNCPAFVADTNTYGGTLVYSLKGQVGSGHYIWDGGSYENYDLNFDPDNKREIKCFGQWYRTLDKDEKELLEPHLEQLTRDFKEFSGH